MFESLRAFNPWSLAPYVVAVPLIFAAGAWWDGEQREDRIREQVVGDFTDSMVVTQLACMTDKATAWEEVANTRTNLANQAARFERVMEGSDEERMAFRAELGASRTASVKLRDEARATMARYDAMRRDLEGAWGRRDLPDDITCGVLRTPGCPDLSRPAAGASDVRAGAVPGGNAGATGSGAGAVVSRPSGAGSGDGEAEGK
jgi:hypothetical protein